MYYQNYEDYMRSILGYPVRQTGYMDTYENYHSNLGTNIEYLSSSPRYSTEILDLYPEIYKIVNPMVCKICDANTKPISRELIETMTDEIYLNLENDPSLVENEVVNIRVNLPKENGKENSINSSRSKGVNTDHSSKGTTLDTTSKRIPDARTSRTDTKTENKQLEPRENRQSIRNNTLRDLIKILILNRLLGGNIRQPRPNPPRPNPPRPPYPGRPNPPRPPFSDGQRQNAIPPIEPRYKY